MQAKAEPQFWVCSVQRVRRESLVFVLKVIKDNLVGNRVKFS